MQKNSSKESDSDNQSTLNEAEAELYDRQLRLWGFEAQQRMQKSKILISGVRGLMAETAKNLVLAGMNVVLQDSEVLQVEDMSALYFATLEEVGQKRAMAALPRLQALNAYVQVTAETTPLENLEEGYFTQFTAVVISDCTESEAVRINDICHRKSIPFFWAGSYAEEGWFFTDFGKEFEYQSDPPKCTVASMLFPSLEQALSVHWKDLIKRHFPISLTYARCRVIHTFKEKMGRLPSPSDISEVTSLAKDLIEQNGLAGAISEVDLGIDRSVCLSSWGQCLPVCSVVGGFLSQEVVKAVSKIGVPMRNVFIFSTENFVGKVFEAVPTSINV